LAFHQQAADQLGCNLLGRAGEEGWGEVRGRFWWLLEWLHLGIRLRFHHHAPQQLALGLALHQQAADELGGDPRQGGRRCCGGSAGRVLVAMGVAWGMDRAPARRSRNQSF